MPIASQQQIQVLHVDDEPDFTDLTGTFLEREDDRFAVETATSADDGLETINNRPPDCVVSDYNMPGMDGITLLQAVREEYPDLPFILFTGKGSEAVASDAIAAGVTDYLQKGSGTEQYELLANRIRNAVQARRETERADRQEQLMRLTEFAGDTGGFELDRDSDTLLLTAGTRRIIGRPDQHEIPLGEAVELFHADDRGDIQETLATAFQTSEELHRTWRLQPDDGDQRLLDIRITPIVENGEVTKLRGAGHDITDQKARQEELRRNERRLNAILEHSTDRLSITDAEGRYTFVSPSVEGSMSHDPTDLTGQEAFEYIHPEDRAETRATLQQILNDPDGIYSAEYRYRDDEGSWRWVESRGTNRLDDPAIEGVVINSREITERKQREQELQRTHDLMTDMEELAEVGSYEYDPETGDMTATAGFYPILEIDPEASMTLDEVFEFIAPEDRGRVRDRFEACLKTGEPYEMDVRAVTADGEAKWITTRGELIDTSANGTVLRGYVQDITERKERGRELRAEQEFTTQALNTLNDLFYVIDADGTLQRWNQKALEVTGYSESKLDDMPAIELFPEDGREAVGKAIEATLTDGEATVNADLLTADGQRIPYEFTGGRLTDEDEAPTGLVGIGRDLTERREQERRFQALVEESNDIISILDADGVFEYQSQSVKRILGYEPEETIGDTAWEYIHPDDREMVMDTFEEWVTNPDMTATVEYRARHADESWRWMEAHRNNQLDNPAVEGYVVNSRDVTARKERQQELAQTHDLMTNMEELADAGAWEYESETERLMLTDGAHRLYGLEPDADLSLDAGFDAVHPDDRNRLRDRFETCLETGEPYEVEVRFTTPDGGQKWVTARGERVTADGNGSAVRGYIQDITEQKQLERDLKQERDLVSGIVETVPVGLSVVDADGSISFVNERLESIGGRSLEELEGMPHDEARYDLVDEHGEPLESGETPFNQVVSRETTIHNQVVGIRRPSGERVWLSVSGAPQYDDGELERTVFAFKDITDRRELEAELSATLGRVSDAFYALDDEFQFTYLNRRAEELLQASEDELLGETVWDAYPEAAETDEVWDAFHAALDTQDPQSLELYYEPLDFWLEASVYPSESGISVYFRDVTEQKEYERELEAQNERLEEFTSVVSHDLRSPLTVAEGRLELAQETCESSHLAQAADALDRSQALIEDLLTLAREGEDVSEVKPVALADVAESSWETIESQSATLETHATQTLQADKSRLTQLFENLYRNAIEHGGDDVTVSVGLIDGGFYVADTGPGIPEGDREEVFEAGYSTNEEGTGFGLRIVRQVANAHGWEVAVTESEQGGTRFEITGVEFVDR